ncbi:Respiratory-chain NADH dehydrogenase, subunit [Fodinibius roseus]|uniref:Respiratory-chain NADH dehydrogenase, subunit n=2 Tax=Fodinibius roseus TaxID=1194090 RepID=A0A1M5JA30_9BACT|nr:Respiratory-chain NADH dehydrogenase, subunit [Fodinibius roseus]
METTMKYGARKGTMNFWRRWLAKAASQELVIFPVPGADLLRMYQSEPLHGEARLADSPKEANVLLLIGDVSTELAERAATVYAQMPRPRVLVIAGPEHLDPLPHPDVHVPLEKDFLGTAIPAARECLSGYSWTEKAEPYRPEPVVSKIEEAGQQQGHMHDHGGHGSHDHGHEGHDHSAHHHGETDGGHNHDQGDRKNHHHDHSDDAEAGDTKDCHGAPAKHSHDSHQHDSHSEHEGHRHHDHGEHEHGHEGHQHKGHNHGEEHQDDDHSAHDHSGHGGPGHGGQHDHSGHGDHGHGGHDHGPGFMSMIAMTKDLPRSPDGLPMEWSDVHFGPFHPGLPGGLRLSMKLDGDTVVIAEAGQGLLGHNLPASVLNDPASLPEYLAAAHPLAPVTYRLLAQKALANFSGKTPDSTLTLSEAVLLEKKRITSHLNWLAVFATALGSDWMRDRAIKHYHRFQNGAGNASRLSEFISRIKKMPYLKLKLSAAGKHRVEMGDHNLGHGHEVHDHSGHGHNHGDQAGNEHHHAGHSHEEHKGHEHREHGGHDHSRHSGHNHGHEDHEHGGHEGHEHHHHEHSGHAGHESHDHGHGSRGKDQISGQLPDEITGPVARAAGIEKDHRLEEPVYQQAGWTPVTAAGNNAWSRLMVRLDEMEQSLRFIARAENDSGGESSQKIDIPSAGMGNGIARIESPRGTVTLKFHIHEGKLAHMQLNTPSEALAGIIQHLTEQYELADALTAVASLDISPWEIHH